MDERHWWIAQRLSHTFNIDQAKIETFICEPDTLEKINVFLCLNGTNKLFFYSTKDTTASTVPSTELTPLHLTPHDSNDEDNRAAVAVQQQPQEKQQENKIIYLLDSLLKLPKLGVTNNDNLIILYFLRYNTTNDIVSSQIHKDVYCGEIKNASKIIHNIYSDLFLPIFKSNKDWGECVNDETKTSIILNMEKYVNSIGTIIQENQNSKNLMLKRAEPEVLAELKQLRLAPDSPTIKICEDLATDWISTIENMLSDICDERFIHPSVGPMSELERWQRKQRLLSSLTEQLKSKECKQVIGALITAKSKVMKKWKVVDTCITDAQNECRDKVKFLESLRRPLDQFYQEATPFTCISSALPNLCTAMRTIESVSRYYARQGYLGLLFTKVTNQIVNICKDYLFQSAILVDSEEQFWPTIMKEIEEDRVLGVKDGSKGSFWNLGDKKQAFNESRKSLNLETNKDGSGNDSSAASSESFYSRLKTCLHVQLKYKEAFRTLRDGLGGSQSLSSFPSVSSMQTNTNTPDTVATPQQQQQQASRDGRNAVATKPQQSQQQSQRRGDGNSGHGILMSEEDIVFRHLDDLCKRIRLILDEIQTLAQFEYLYRTSSGLSRPKKEDLGYDLYDDNDLAAVGDSHEAVMADRDEFADDIDEILERNAVENMLIVEDISPDPVGHLDTQRKAMDTLVEESEESMVGGLGSGRSGRSGGGGAVERQNSLKSNKSKSTTKVSSEQQLERKKPQETNEVVHRNKEAEKLFKQEQRVENDTKIMLNKAQTLSKEDLRLMRKYYNKTSEGPTIMVVIKDYLNHMIDNIKAVSAKQMIDVETKSSNIFDQKYKVFATNVYALEKFLASYLNIIFIKPKKTQEGLNILMKFEPVSQRSVLRAIINDKFVEMFANYEADLMTTRKTYEEFKANPPLLRNAPPVAGAIVWVRQLLKNIEEPMKSFQLNKYISNLEEFQRISKVYNRIASTLIAYETLYFNQWKSSIEQAKLGIKAHLLYIEPDTNRVLINSDNKVLELIHEAKWLQRVGIEIPQSAKELLGQEKKLKQYKSNLETLFNDFEATYRLIPKHLLKLYEPHIKQTLDACNPGCVILTWSSLNIDAFLKSFEVSINKLKNIVYEINNIKEKQILKLIQDIKSIYLFDYEYAFSKRWSPNEFLDIISRTVSDKATLVTDKISRIEAIVGEIAQILTIPQLANFANSAVVTAATQPKRGLIGLNKSNNTAANITGSSGGGGNASKPQTFRELCDTDPKLRELQEYYSVNLFDAIHTSIKKSLKLLAIACGYKFPNEMDDDDELNEHLINETMSSFHERSLLTNVTSSNVVNDDGSVQGGRLNRRDAGVDTNNDRPMSTASILSRATWSNERQFENAFLSLELIVKYSIPEVVVEPSLVDTQKTIKTIAFHFVEISKRINWLHPHTNTPYYEAVCRNTDIMDNLNIFNRLSEDIGPTLKSHMNHFKLFDFLWKEDLTTLFNEFMKYNSDDELRIKREVERLVRIEQNVMEIPEHILIGPICLKTDPIKISLKSFSFTWKTKYASKLHELARTRLRNAIEYRENIKKRLNINVQTLEQLNDALKLIEELSDMENKIDKIYLPIENLYDDLKRYNLLLERDELDEVYSLRTKWSQLMKSAENVRTLLLHDKRNALEQELDKQVKTFVVEVIRFRNLFDAQGPCVHGIEPDEAVSRLDEFQVQYDNHDLRRKTLDSISILFGLQCKPFAELDKTGEELQLLNQLYAVYQKFLTFDKQFKMTLWSDSDLLTAISQIEQFWTEFCNLPTKLQDNWEAYYDLKASLVKYRNILPILLLLNNKEIRNRHWLQVMQVTKSTFILESSQFRLNDIMDIGLDAHEAEIEEICKSAKKEQELENKMRQIEEEWNEQVLNFTNYKDYGEVCLDKEYTMRLLEQLDDAQESLVLMLGSKYVQPLRDEVSTWSEKLKTIAEVLELWIEVQDAWINMECVFSNQQIVKDMPNEAKRFTRVDKSWIRSQKQSFDMKSVLQCCLGTSVQENTKRLLLKEIQKELEICFKTLTQYLDKKRRTFPRFYFLSNNSLLTLLSSDAVELKSYYSTLFNCLSDFRIEEMHSDGGGRGTGIGGYTSAELYVDQRVNPTRLGTDQKRRSQLNQSVGIESSMGQHSSSNGVTSVQQQQQQHQSQSSHQYEIVEVFSNDGEVLELHRRVQLEPTIENWLLRLKDSIGDTLKRSLNNSLQDLYNGTLQIDELASKYTTQVCLICLSYIWTKEAEASINEIKNDRKSVTFASKKFSQILYKLLNMCTKVKWTNLDKPMLNVHRLRLESMINFCSYLKNSFDALASRRVKDLTDFEWLRCFRVYLQDSGDDDVYNSTSNSSLNSTNTGISGAMASDVNARVHARLCVMDDTYQYGQEFYGVEQNYVLTMSTERAFLSIWHAGKICKSALISGKSNSGKTQIAKGFAQFLGRYLGYLYVTLHTDSQVIGNVLQGLAQEGTWGLFEEVQNMNTSCLSWFNEYLSAIYQALRRKAHSTYLIDGKEITINQNFQLISTMNPFNKPGYQIPIEIRSMYRVVSLMEPDLTQIIEAKCIQYGIKCGNILSNRLKNLYDICHDSLSLTHESKSQITISNLIDILHSFYQQKKRQQALSSNDSRPNTRVSSETQHAAYKFASPKIEILASQIVPVKELTRKNRISLVNYSKADHLQISQILIDVISPRLNPNDSKVFQKIVQDLFFKDEVSRDKQGSAQQSQVNLEKLISEKATNDYNLYPNQNWIEKCLQIYSVSKIYRGIILLGSPCTGKTSTLTVLCDALSEFSKKTATASSSSSSVFKQHVSATHKLKKIHPMAIDDESILFGSVVQSNDWKDGLLTYMMRKASRNQSTTWLCLDGPILPNWSDNFNTIFDLSSATASTATQSEAGGFLQLKNGDRITNLCKIVFETVDISQASPTILSKAGIVYYGEDLVGWRSIARSWFDSRNKNEIQFLQKCFNKTMDDVSQYVLKECKPIIPVKEESLFQSCLNLLGALLSENTNIGGEMHIERLYLFCLIWTFGGVVEQNDQKGFSDLLNHLVTALPDDDLKSSVFEYYVDESGEWDLWSARVQEEPHVEYLHFLDNMFIETADTLRCRIFLDLAYIARQNVLLFGQAGSGKTLMLQNYIQDFDAAVPTVTNRYSNMILSKRLNFSSSTSVSQIEKFLQANIVHRQGYTYGAVDKKNFIVFIDDVNAPCIDNDYGVQRCDEFLRQVADSKILYNQSKPFEIKKLESVMFYATMTTTLKQQRTLDPRLLRHFTLIHLPQPKGQAMKSILSGILESSLLLNDRPPIDYELQSIIIDASHSLLEQCNEALRACPTPGREHYLFSTKHIVTILTSLKRLTDLQRSDSVQIVSYWRYEVLRTIGDQLPRFIDHLWLDNCVGDLVKEKLAPYCPSDKLVDTYLTFPLDNRCFDRQLSSQDQSANGNGIRVQLNQLESIDSVRVFIEESLARYKEEFTHHHLNITISENIVHHIIRIHRIISFGHSGNILLIGTNGNNLSNLIKLAIYVAQINLLSVDSSKHSQFFDSIRSAVRLAGTEGKPIGLIFTSRDLREPEYMDTVNSLLNNGECVHLFSNDEIDGLYQAVGPSIKRDYPNFIIDPKKYFNQRVRKNLHICIAISPHSRTYGRIIRSYTTMIANTHIYWICDWNDEYLLSESKYFMKNHSISTDTANVELNEKLSQTIFEIHAFMLKECKQLTWAGSMEREMRITHTKIIEKKKEQIQKTYTLNVPNWPYSKTILQEQIKNQHVSTTDKSKMHFFIGPSTYQNFMNTFWYLFTTKAKQCEHDILRLRRVLETLNKTRSNAKDMKQYIKELRGKCKDAEYGSGQLLRRLVEKTTIVEKLKAKYGHNSSLATLMQMQDDVDEKVDVTDEHNLLLDDAYDEYDKEFIRMREQNLKSKQAKLAEELERARHSVEDCKRALVDKRKQAEFWRNKVDKSCIERIRAFQNPPALIGQIMDMVTIMIGKIKPSTAVERGEFVSVAKLDRSEDYTTLSGPNMATSKSNSDLKAKSKIGSKMERLDRAHWKQYQLLMQDAAKFVDMLHDVNLDEGLNPDVNQAVETYLAKGKDGQLGITGEGLLLENPGNVNVTPTKLSETEKFKGITIAAARYASEDAATLVHYAIAVVEFTRQCGPLRQAKERVENLKKEITDYENKKQERDNEITRLKQLEASLRSIFRMTPDNGLSEEQSVTADQNEEELTEEALERYMIELKQLQDDFDIAAVKKYKLKNELEDCIQRLDAATSVIESDYSYQEPDQWSLPSSSNSNSYCSVTSNSDLYVSILSSNFKLGRSSKDDSLIGLEEQWKKWIDEHLSHEQTLTNCLIAASFITYLGPFSTSLRKRLCNQFFQICIKNSIPREPQQIFKDISLAEFLYTPIQLKELNLLRLPFTETVLDNCTFIMEDKSYDHWPLICDSSRHSIDWIQTYYKNKTTLHIVKFTELKSMLDTCLSEGQHLLITDCNVKLLKNSVKLETVLRNKLRFMQSDKAFKLSFGQQEIECKPTFRLFLHTISDSIEVPPDIAAYSTVVTYNLTRADVEEELLDRFMELAKPRIDAERYLLLQEKVDTLKIIDPLEQDITDFLASDVNLLHSVEPTKRLSDLKKLYDEAVDSNLRIEASEESLIKTRESFREIAQRAAVCYDVIASLKEINKNSIISFKQFTDLYDDAIYQFERSSIPQVITRLTQTTYLMASSMLSELDKKLYAILLSLEIESASDRVAQGEKEYIISPAYGAHIMQILTNKQTTEHKYWVYYKKPFDWMTDEQFVNLQYLAIHYTWFYEVFERMSKDGRETQWRSLCESETPENAVLPDKLDETCTPTQRLCILRAVRGDRVLQLCYAYVNMVLGKQFLSNSSVDFGFLYSQSKPSKPILLMFTDEAEAVRRSFVNYARANSDRQTHFSVIDMNTFSISEDQKNIRKYLAKPMQDGSWILLHNCHYASSVLVQIESILNETALSKTLSNSFRCWLSVLQTPESWSELPSSLFVNSVRGLVAAPITMKENISRTFSCIDQETLRLSNKAEWPPLLHNLCYLHSCFKLRSRYPKCGWNAPYNLTDITTEEFMDAIKSAVRDFALDQPLRTDSAKSGSESGRFASWSAIKFIVSDLIYGSLAADKYDLEAIQLMSDFWISTVAVRRDFELSKLKYKIPGQFFVQQQKLGVLQQALDNLPHGQLDQPEACHLMQSIETVLGDDLYIMTRLNKLCDSLPYSNSSSKLFERPPTPFTGPNMVMVNSSSSNPLIYSSSTFSTANFVAMQSKKFLDLSEYCANILSTKIPKLWTKEQIYERVKKNGGQTGYNSWIVAEFNQLGALISTIKSNLISIKNATTDGKKLGCNWDEAIVDVAESLYYSRIPDSWCLQSGIKYTFPYYGLASFFNDLVSRFQHMEKCLTMGRDKNPAFNLSAFFWPQTLLSLFKLETFRLKNQNDENPCLETLVFQSEMTARDKEHLRDPPKEGIFVYGLYLWGCHWEKSTCELIDQSCKNKEGHTQLPVIHLTCWPQSEKPLLNDTQRALDLYACPVYVARNQRDQEPLFHLDVWHSGIPSSRWSMRGVCASVKPY